MGLEKLPDILQALAAEEVDYVLIGAVAMMAHGLVRGTEDVDFFVRPDAENIARLRKALRRVFPDDPAIDEISEKDLAGDYPAGTIHLTVPLGSIFWPAWTRRFPTVTLNTRKLSLKGSRYAWRQRPCCTA